MGGVSYRVRAADLAQEFESALPCALSKATKYAKVMRNNTAEMAANTKNRLRVCRPSGERRSGWKTTFSSRSPGDRAYSSPGFR